jgi:hypothetical protein
MDDTPDKLRRNVVVLSAAILAIAFFRLSFKTTGTLLGFAEVGNVSPLKVWLALGATLAYMFLRWRYAVDTQTELVEVTSQFQDLRKAAVELHIASHLRAHLISGRPIPMLSEPTEFVDEELAERISLYGRVSQVEISVSIRQMQSHLWWTGQAGIDLFVEWPNGHHYGRNGGRMPDFLLDRRERNRVWIASAWRAATASRIGVDVAVPFGLAAIAAFTCLFNLAYFIAN